MVVSPELSVLMTVYNGQFFVYEALKSILLQTFTDFELIVIDDASTDQSDAIIKSFTDKRLRFIQNPERKGIPVNRKYLFEIASGRFITYVDGDDLLEPDKFEKQLFYLKNNPAYGFVGSSVILIDKYGYENDRLKLDAKPGLIPAIMLFRNYFVNSAVMFRKEIVPPGLFDFLPDFGEDYYLWWKLLQKTKGKNLPEFLTLYRRHSHSVTSQVEENRKELDKRIYRIIFNDLGFQPDDEELEIHFGISTWDKVSSVSEMKKILDWLARIAEFSYKAGIKDLKPVLRERWLKVCFKASQKPAVMFYGFYQFVSKFSMFFNK